MFFDIALYGCLGTVLLVLGAVGVLELRRRLIKPEDTLPHVAWLAEHLALTLVDANDQPVERPLLSPRYAAQHLEVRGKLAAHAVRIRHFRSTSRLRPGRPRLWGSEHVRIEVAVANPDDLSLYLSREHALSPIGKALGVQDIQIGVPSFDDAFVVQSNQPGILKQRFDAGLLHRMIEAWERHRPPRTAHIRLEGDRLVYEEPGRIDGVDARNRAAGMTQLLAALTALVPSRPAPPPADSSTGT